MADSSDATQIRKLIENWAQAVREKNMDAVLAHHAEDIVMFDVPVPLQSRGMAEYRSTWELFFAHNPGGEGSFDMMEVEITTSDSVAFCHALIGIRGSRCRLTMGLVKSDGQWIVAHEHHSYPVELEDQS